MDLRAGSLVLYRSQPAIVREIAEKKIAIQTPDGGQASVRPKDVVLLHPGPLRDLADLRTPGGDPLTAWELLAGQTTNLTELAELTYGEFTPESAWAAWQLVTDGLYFSGTPEAILTHTDAKVEEVRATRAARQAEEVAWKDFQGRAAAGAVTTDDERYLADVIALALGRTSHSRALRTLGRSETPESAHAFLLESGYWSPAVNPYPGRFQMATTQPTVGLGALPDEARRDLTHLTALAIDDEDSADPDDAVSMDEGYLWVHVADVGALVEPDSPADTEARNRAANLYLPEGTVQMLPTALTDQLALGLHPVSPALSFALDLEVDGKPSLREIVPSWIRVTRLSYEAAEGHLHEAPFRELHLLAESNRLRRVANGSVEIEFPEVKVRVADDGRVTVKTLYPLRSRTLVREAMLMAGEALANYASERAISLAYSVQDPPSEGELPPTGLARDYAQRRLMQRTVQRTLPGRHAGLGLDTYVQATSPLRRYLDLVAHQQIRAHIARCSLLDATAVTQRIGATDATIRAVRNAERQSNQHWTLVYLTQNPDWQGDGIVVEKRGGRYVLLIPDLAWETELHNRSSLALNSLVGLRLSGIDLPNRSARFEVVGVR